MATIIPQTNRTEMVRPLHRHSVTDFLLHLYYFLYWALASCFKPISTHFSHSCLSFEMLKTEGTSLILGSQMHERIDSDMNDSKANS